MSLLLSQLGGGGVALDPCIQNPIPLPNGMGIFQQSTASGARLRHISDGNQIIVRSDYALWCCQCNKFVPKSEVGVDTPGLPETFKGIF